MQLDKPWKKSQAVEEEEAGKGVVAVLCRAAFLKHGKQAQAIPIIHFYGERVWSGGDPLPRKV